MKSISIIHYQGIAPCSTSSLALSKPSQRATQRATQRNENATQRKNVATKKKVAPKAKEILESSDLEDWEEVFCLEYLRHFNKTKAYHKARPDVTYGSASVEG